MLIHLYDGFGGVVTQKPVPPQSAERIMQLAMIRLSEEEAIKIVGLVVERWVKVVKATSKPAVNC